MKKNDVRTLSSSTTITTKTSMTQLASSSSSDDYDEQQQQQKQQQIQERRQLAIWQANLSSLAQRKPDLIAKFRRKGFSLHQREQEQEQERIDCCHHRFTYYDANSSRKNCNFSYNFNNKNNNNNNSINSSKSFDQDERDETSREEVDNDDDYDDEEDDDYNDEIVEDNNNNSNNVTNDTVDVLRNPFSPSPSISSSPLTSSSSVSSTLIDLCKRARREAAKARDQHNKAVVKPCLHLAREYLRTSERCVGEILMFLSNQRWFRRFRLNLSRFSWPYSMSTPTLTTAAAVVILLTLVGIKASSTIRHVVVVLFGCFIRQDVLFWLVNFIDHVVSLQTPDLIEY